MDVAWPEHRAYGPVGHVSRERDEWPVVVGRRGSTRVAPRTEEGHFPEEGVVSLSLLNIAAQGMEPAPGVFFGES